MFSTLFRKLFRPRESVVRWKTRDNAGPNTAILYRMGAGFPGDINRVHPFAVEPCLIDSSAPPTKYGEAVVIDPTSQGIRPINANDDALDAIHGVLVRPYPSQQSTATAGAPASLGAATPPTAGVGDVLTSGYIMVNVVGTPVKRGRVFIWTDTTNGSYTPGCFCAAACSGSTIELDEKSYFNGGPDAAGVCELAFNL